MSQQRSDGPERPELGADDVRFVARLRQHYTPAPLTPARRVAFDAALEARRARRDRGLGFAFPLGVAAAAAALAVALLWTPDAPAPEAPAPVARVAPEAGLPATTAREDWAETLLLADAARFDPLAAEPEDAAVEDGEILPVEYAAIAGVFLE